MDKICGQTVQYTRPHARMKPVCLGIDVFTWPYAGQNGCLIILVMQPGIPEQLLYQSVAGAGRPVQELDIFIVCEASAVFAQSCPSLQKECVTLVNFQKKHTQSPNTFLCITQNFLKTFSRNKHLGNVE